MKFLTALILQKYSFEVLRLQTITQVWQYTIYVFGSKLGIYSGNQWLKYNIKSTIAFIVGKTLWKILFFVGKIWKTNIICIYNIFKYTVCFLVIIGFRITHYT